MGLVGHTEGLAFTLNEMESSLRILCGGVICDLCFKGLTLTSVWRRGYWKGKEKAGRQDRGC